MAAFHSMTAPCVLTYNMKNYRCSRPIFFIWRQEMTTFEVQVDNELEFAEAFQNFYNLIGIKKEMVEGRE